MTPVFLPGKSHGQKSLAGYIRGVTRVRHDLATTPPPPLLTLRACNSMNLKRSTVLNMLSLGLGC